MKLKIALIFILIIMITVLMFGAVVNADEYIIKPEKVNYYDSIYSATPGGGSFFDPDKTYNSFFSPYATSEVKVNSSFSFIGCIGMSYNNIAGTLTESQINQLKKEFEDSFFLISHNGSGSYNYSIIISAIIFNYSENYFSVWFHINYTSNLVLSSGSLGFYNVSDYEIFGPIFEVGYTQYDDYSYIQGIQTYFFYVQSFNMNSQFVLPIVCTADSLLFLFSNSISGVLSPALNKSFNSILSLNDVIIDERLTQSKIGGVYDLHFDNSLSNSIFTINLTTDTNSSMDIINSSEFEELIFTFEFGTLIPYSEDVGYSGGQNYGSWSSNSCDWYDIPCHLGNALGYFVYEFPLTKPITTLFTGLVGYLDTFFDISSEFSGVEVIYGVLITMIVVGIVVALFKG